MVVRNLYGNDPYSIAHEQEYGTEYGTPSIFVKELVNHAHCLSSLNGASINIQNSRPVSSNKQVILLNMIQLKQLLHCCFDYRNYQDP